MSYRDTDFRLARILVGDTLQRIALRELGTAERWPDLIHLNRLSPPYLVATREEAEQTPGTLAYGQQIRVSSLQAKPSAVADEDLYGQDVALAGGLLRVEDGDFAVVAGLANLRQALSHRIVTDPGELLYHPEYGCKVRLVLGERQTAVFGLLAAGFVRRALQAEPRVASVANAAMEGEGDVLRVSATVLPVGDNTPTDLNLVFPEE